MQQVDPYTLSDQAVVDYTCAAVEDEDVQYGHFWLGEMDRRGLHQLRDGTDVCAVARKHSWKPTSPLLAAVEGSETRQRAFNLRLLLHYAIEEDAVQALIAAKQGGNNWAKRIIQQWLTNYGKDAEIATFLAYDFHTAALAIEEQNLGLAMANSAKGLDPLSPRPLTPRPATNSPALSSYSLPAQRSFSADLEPPPPTGGIDERLFDDVPFDQTPSFGNDDPFLPLNRTFSPLLDHGPSPTAFSTDWTDFRASASLSPPPTTYDHARSPSPQLADEERTGPSTAGRRIRIKGIPKRVLFKEFEDHYSFLRNLPPPKWLDPTEIVLVFASPEAAQSALAELRLEKSKITRLYTTAVLEPEGDSIASALISAKIVVHLGNLPSKCKPVEVQQLLRQVGRPFFSVSMKRRPSHMSAYFKVASGDDYRHYKKLLDGHRYSQQILFIERSPPPPSISHPFVHIGPLSLDGGKELLQKISREAKCGAYSLALVPLDDDKGEGRFRCPSPESCYEAVERWDSEIIEGEKVKARWYPPWKRAEGEEGHGPRENAPELVRTTIAAAKSSKAKNVAPPTGPRAERLPVAASSHYVLQPTPPLPTVGPSSQRRRPPTSSTRPPLSSRARLPPSDAHYVAPSSTPAPSSSRLSYSHNSTVASEASGSGARRGVEGEEGRGKKARRE